MKEQGLKGPNETQEILIEKEEDDIRTLEDGHDLLYWTKSLSLIFVVGLINKIKIDVELTVYLKNIEPEIKLQNIYKLISVVQNSQNQSIREKMGRLIQEEQDRQMYFDRSVELVFENITAEQEVEIENLINQDENLAQYYQALKIFLESRFDLKEGEVAKSAYINKLYEFLSEGSAIEKDLATKFKALVESVLGKIA